MFTGIIANLGKIVQITSNNLTIVPNQKIISKTNSGTSIAVNGVCLTVVKIDNDCFTVDIMPETWQKTNLQYLKPSCLVNLELPATPTTFLSGHIVQGHIDGLARLEKISRNTNSRILHFSIPSDLSVYFVEKGSIALNGVSLTVIKTGKNYFTVGIIPYTWDNTNFQVVKAGNFINIEVDILAKYIKKLLRK